MQHSTTDLLDAIDQLQIDYRCATNVITESGRRIAELEQQLALAAQHADVQQLSRQSEWNNMQNRLHAALDLAAHRGHYLALALDENWRLRELLEQAERQAAHYFSYARDLEGQMMAPEIHLDAMIISSECASVDDYVKEM